MTQSPAHARHWRAPILGGTLLVLPLAILLIILMGMVMTPAQAATLFGDDFEDGDAGGWTTSGGTWSVVTDGSRVYRQAGTSSDARALAVSTDPSVVTGPRNPDGSIGHSDFLRPRDHPDLGARL